MQNPAKKRGDAWDQDKDVLADVIILSEKRSEILRKRLRRLPTISDTVAAYKAIRRPRGPYRTPLPEDLI